MITICGPSRGRYGYPWRIDGSRGIKNWRSESGRKLPRPFLVRCGDPEHERIVKGTRRNFARAYCYVQRWIMTRRELREAGKALDIFSLEMPSRFLCPDCARRERKRSNEA